MRISLNNILIPDVNKRANSNNDSALKLKSAFLYQNFAAQDTYEKTNSNGSYQSSPDISLQSPSFISVPKYKNLNPLEKDTVSFTARRKLEGENMRYAPPECLCKKVEKNAEPAAYYLETVLDKYLSPYTDNKSDSNNKKNPVFDYKVRIKSSTSIREKVVSKYSENLSKQRDDFVAQVSELLLKNFELNKGISKDLLYTFVGNTVNDPSSDTNPPPYTNIEYILSQIIADLENFSIIDFSQHSPKKQKSIYELMIEEMEETAKSKHYDENSYINPGSISGIKYYANDIAGARITMNESSYKSVSVVLNALEQAVNDGALVITSIENNIPDTDSKELPQGKKISDYKYAKDSQLRMLAEQAKAPLFQNKSKSGYMSIHINVDLSNQIFNSYNRKYNGYSGEIQIIGRDVEKLKDIEDLCYKLKDSKNTIHSAYNPFKTHFFKYYTEGSSSTKKAFDDYTYDLYLAQKAIPPGSKDSDPFPSIKELGYKGKVPEELDFNILRQIKQKCDILRKLDDEDSSKDSDRKQDNLNLDNPNLKKLKNEGDINTLKSEINYIINKLYNKS